MNMLLNLGTGFADMKDSNDDLPMESPIELRAFYSVPELAKAANVTRWRMKRLLESAGIVLARNGSDFVVYLSSIRQQLPQLYASLICAEEVKRARLERRRWDWYYD